MVGFDKADSKTIRKLSLNVGKFLRPAINNKLMDPTRTHNDTEDALKTYANGVGSSKFIINQIKGNA